ncbi:MAG: lipopolysaccharide biosynthesis protein [Oscillospiraceae bacterium]|nr:lipopolysaccharide biosynthesis protein [Oscillospiraceae bacterium]
MAKQRSNTLNTYINIITSVGVMVVNLFISFWLSPYIIRTIGVEANGFVSLANNFVTYANLIVTALNAMAARFITIAYIQQDYKKANLYYNSVFWGNLIIVAVLLLPAAYLVVKLENFIEVPADILLDVKILFSLVFLSFFVRTGAPNYDCGTYVTNRMDLSYLPNIATSLLRCVLLVGMFTIWTPHVWYVSFTSTLIGFITLAIAGYYTHKLTPELRVNLKKPICSWKAIKELVGAGIWSAISNSGNMLLSGLDLLVCNVFVGATPMGILSVSKTMPSILIQFSESIRGAFGPELTISFAKGDMEDVYKNISKAMKITSVAVTIPTAGLVVMSDAFYTLWVPDQDAELLQMLTTLAILSYLVNSGIVILFNVFSTVNKVKINSLAMIISGACSILFTFLLIYFTDWDLYAVAGVSSVVTICKNLFFTIPVASKLLGYKWYKFYPQVGISMLCSGMNILVGIIVRMIMPVDTWVMFFLSCGIIGMLGLGTNMMIVLTKQERHYFLDIIKRWICF